MQLHPGERLQRLKSFFQVLSTDYPGSLRSLGSPELGLRIVGHAPPCCWQCSPPATLYHCRSRLDVSQFERHGVTGTSGTSGESFSFVRTLSAIQTYQRFLRIWVEKFSVRCCCQLCKCAKDLKEVPSCWYLTSRKINVFFRTLPNFTW